MISSRHTRRRDISQIMGHRRVLDKCIGNHDFELEPSPTVSQSRSIPVNVIGDMVVDEGTSRLINELLMKGVVNRDHVEYSESNEIPRLRLPLSGVQAHAARLQLSRD